MAFVDEVLWSRGWHSIRAGDEQQSADGGIDELHCVDW